jgi:hypothetical protein
MMTSAEVPGSPSTQANSAPGTLRKLLDDNRANGNRVPLAKAIDLLVPLCADLADIHRQGYGVHVHPSNLVIGSDGTLGLSPEAAADPANTDGDKACLPPESGPDDLGDARASVYSVGAILYEMLTGASVGKGMRRPSELVKGIPPACETLMAKALITDPARRPDDLKALAQALYGLSPQPTVPPPPAADMTHLQSVGDLDIDVSLSMLPPPPGEAGPVSGVGAVPALPNSANGRASGPTSSGRGVAPTGGGYNLAVVSQPRPQPQSAPQSGATAELAALKARLESDPAPIYVVIKDGMDHGPFSAVELLQQIASHTFTEDDVLRNDTSGQEKTIGDWEEFAPFAEQAKLHRDIQEERLAVDRGVAQESKRTRGKAFIGILVLGVLLLGAATWFVTQVGTRSDEVAVHVDQASNVEAEGELAAKKRAGGSAGGKRRRVVGKSGNIPLLAGGQSCEGAQAAYVEEMKMSGGGQADITRAKYASVMNNGSYLNGCGLPSSVAVNVCVAVQNGRAVGVTVRTKPDHPAKRCIASNLRRKSFPSHPKLDVVRTSFAAQ